MLPGKFQEVSYFHVQERGSNTVFANLLPLNLPASKRAHDWSWLYTWLPIVASNYILHLKHKLRETSHYGAFFLSTVSSPDTWSGIYIYMWESDASDLELNNRPPGKLWTFQTIRAKPARAAKHGSQNWPKNAREMSEYVKICQNL